VRVQVPPGLVGLLARRWRRPQADVARAMPPLRPRWRGPFSRSRRRGERPQEVHVHLQACPAEDIAAILNRRDGP
jgi:hypothetical protein